MYEKTNMLVRLLTTKLCKDSCIRRNDEVSDHQRPPLADEAQRNSGISLIVVNMRTSRKTNENIDERPKNYLPTFENAISSNN